MAMPIAPTPKLDKKETEALLRRMAKDLKKPVGPVPTPKLEEAIQLIKAKNACREKK